MSYECGKVVENYLLESLEFSGIFRNFRERRAGYAFPLYYTVAEINLVFSAFFRIFVVLI